MDRTTKDIAFDLDIFLKGAKNTASLLDSEFTVTDNTTGRILGGTGIIMSQLINQVERLRARASDLERLIGDDAYAITFQSLGQYRSALLKSIRG